MFPVHTDWSARRGALSKMRSRIEDSLRPAYLFSFKCHRTSHGRIRPLCMWLLTDLASLPAKSNGLLKSKPTFSTFWYRILKYHLKSDFQGEKIVLTFLNVENHREAGKSPSVLFVFLGGVFFFFHEIHHGTKHLTFFPLLWHLSNLKSLW